MNPAETIALQVEERERQAKELAAWRALRETSAKEWAQIRTLYAEAEKRLDSIGKKPGSIGMNNGDLAIFFTNLEKS